MYEFIDKAVVLFLRHKGREIRTYSGAGTELLLLSLVNKPVVGVWFFSCWSHLFMFDMRMLKV